jgi:hypothetical protein
MASNVNDKFVTFLVSWVLRVLYSVAPWTGASDSAAAVDCWGTFGSWVLAVWSTGQAPVVPSLAAIGVTQPWVPTVLQAFAVALTVYHTTHPETGKAVTAFLQQVGALTPPAGPPAA